MSDRLNEQAEKLKAFEQHGFDVRFGWGPNGLRRIAPHVETVVIVDVLSFSTSVDIAVSRGVTVFPYPWNNNSEAEFAAERNAIVAGSSGGGRLSLRPESLVNAASGTRLVLPSPNGSALTFGARDAGADQVLVGCLRNARAIADACGDSRSVGVIAAGERWRGETGPLRPALEDQLGAGAIISALGRASISPEAMVTAAAFESSTDRLAWVIEQCGSGREHLAKGNLDTIRLASELNVSTTTPTLDGEQLTG